MFGQRTAGPEGGVFPRPADASQNAGADRRRQEGTARRASGLRRFGRPWKKEGKRPVRREAAKSRAVSLPKRLPARKRGGGRNLSEIGEMRGSMRKSPRSRSGPRTFFIGYGAVRRPGGGHASSEPAGRAIGADLPEACPGGRRKACRTRVCFRLPRDAWREVWSLRLRGVPRRAGVRGLRPVRPWEVSVCPHPDAWPGDVLRRTVPDESWAAWDRLLRASPWAVWDRRVFPERRREVCARRGAVTEDALPEVLFPGVLYLAADDVRG